MNTTKPYPWATRVEFAATDRDCAPLELGHGLRLAGADFEDKLTYKTVVDGEPIYENVLTANGEVSRIKNAHKVLDRTLSRVTLRFECGADELLTGLGQHDSGVYDYRSGTEYLYQNNMIISYPFLISSAGWGLLIEAECAMVYHGSDTGFSFTLEAVDGFSIVAFTGGCTEVLRHLADWTGKTRLLPRWAYGYVQSKERYKSQQELIDTAREFRERGLGLDCLVQDWYTWEDGLWGEKTPDASRFPDVPKLIEELHALDVHLLVSIWPNMAEGGRDCAEFKRANLMLPNSTTYDAYKEAGRELYWQQCERVWGAGGVDGYWCDNAETFSDADWNGEVKRPEALRYQVVQDLSNNSIDEPHANSYALYHSQGMYEGWRSSHPDKRLVNLTRSGFPGVQSYGTVLWSGDVAARWDVLRQQIAEGLKSAMSGISHWTFDIGGFFVVKDAYEKRGCECHNLLEPRWFWSGDYNDGVHDPAYRELYVRWFQMGCFLPMFRSHGTDTPREPWQFGNPGDVEYDTIKAFTELRYQLIPYIYSLAAQAWFAGDPMLRSLMTTFPDDLRARPIHDSFMLGESLLVHPVTTPLTDGGNLTEVYLPECGGWYDLFSARYYDGGQLVAIDTPLHTLPVFVRAGTILPRSNGGESTARLSPLCDELTVYPGADCKFSLYGDSGDGYEYESGAYTRVPICWDDDVRTLTLGTAEGTLGLTANIRVRLGSTMRDIKYTGESITIALSEN